MRWRWIFGIFVLLVLFPAPVVGFAQGVAKQVTGGANSAVNSAPSISGSGVSVPAAAVPQTVVRGPVVTTAPGVVHQP